MEPWGTPQERVENVEMETLMQITWQREDKDEMRTKFLYFKSDN